MPDPDEYTVNVYITYNSNYTEKSWGSSGHIVAQSLAGYQLGMDPLDCRGLVNKNVRT